LLSIERKCNFSEQNGHFNCLQATFDSLKNRLLKTSVMKKSNAQITLLAVLFLISLCSYAYLATRNSETIVPSGNDSSNTVQVEEENKVKKSAKYFLLDVEIIKKLSEAARRLLPAS